MALKPSESSGCGSGGSGEPLEGFKKVRFNFLKFILILYVRGCVCSWAGYGLQGFQRIPIGNSFLTYGLFNLQTLFQYGLIP